MRRFLVALACLPAIAAGQTCTPGEYQQYKDKAATSLSSLANDYCLAYNFAYIDMKSRRDLIRAGVRPGPAASDRCLAEMGKMADAAAAAGKAGQFRSVMANSSLCQMAEKTAAEYRASQ